MTERRATCMWVSMQVSIHVCISGTSFWGEVYRRPCIPKSG